MRPLRQSTAATVTVGPLVSTNGAAYSPTNILGTFSLNGARSVATVTGTNNADGTFDFVLPATNIASAGRLSFTPTNSTAYVPRIDHWTVYPASTYDATFGTNSTAFTVDAATGAFKVEASYWGTNTISGALPVNDKTGYSLTQSFPPNFSSLDINAGGSVTIQDGSLDFSTLTTGLWAALSPAIITVTGSTTPTTAGTYLAQTTQGGQLAYANANLSQYLWFNGTGYTISSTAGSNGSAYWTATAITGPYTANGTASGTPSVSARGNAQLAGTQMQLTLPDGAVYTNARAAKLDNLDVAVSGRMPSGNVTVGGYASGQDPATAILVTPANKLATDGTGRVTIGTNADKAGYTLSQSFPANFAAMAITGGGAVTAGTVSDKTGYALTSTEHTAIAADVLDASASAHNTAGSIGQKVNAAASAGDPWSTSLPGSYASGQAGYIVGQNLDAKVSGVGAAVWAVLTSTLTVAGTIGKKIVGLFGTDGKALLSSDSQPTLSANAVQLPNPAPSGYGSSGNVTVGGYAAGQDPATLVLDAAASSHASAGSVGAKISSAASAGDPLQNPVPGTYAAGTAGYVIGHSSAGGSGTVAVDHNTGGTDHLRAEVNGQGISGIVVRAYAQADFNANPRTYDVQGEAVTGTDGRWASPMYLSAGTYAFVFDGGDIRWPVVSNVVVS
jgi:hypothetical protein